jgi:LacI family transcriptional regulator
MSRDISQQRIAKDLGVSQALVSLVLNGKRENISEESYQRIWKYALKRGYRPKGMQVNGGARSNTVGFILRAGLRLYTQSNFFSHVQHGLHMALQERAYHTAFLGAEDHLPHQVLQQKLQRENLFGVLILGQVQETFVKSLLAAQKNLVAVSANYPGLSHSVMPNEKQALELLVTHLTGLGHERFAWIGGNKLLRHNSTRHQALDEALRQRGLGLSEEWCADVVNGDRIDGQKAAELLLKGRPESAIPTAWVCLNGLMARGAINYLMRKGFDVPEQISVVAVDATRVCEEEHPQITGANASPEKMGAKAAELLLQHTDGDGALVDVILPAQLTVRESSGKAKQTVSLETKAGMSRR